MQTTSPKVAKYMTCTFLILLGQIFYLCPAFRPKYQIIREFLRVIKKIKIKNPTKKNKRTHA